MGAERHRGGRVRETQREAGKETDGGERERARETERCKNGGDGERETGEGVGGGRKRQMWKRDGAGGRGRQK